MRNLRATKRAQVTGRAVLKAMTFGECKRYGNGSGDIVAGYGHQYLTSLAKIDLTKKRAADFAFHLNNGSRLRYPDQRSKKVRVDKRHNTAVSCENAFYETEGRMAQQSGAHPLDGPPYSMISVCVHLIPLCYILYPNPTDLVYHKTSSL